MSGFVGRNLASGSKKPTTPKPAGIAAFKSAAQQAVRTRLEEVIDRAKKEKAGKKPRFHLDPQRLKKLKALLVKKAAEDIKADQEKKTQERRRALSSAIGTDLHSNVNGSTELADICKQYHARIRKLHEEKYDLQMAVRGRDYVLNELTIEVNQLRGKFIKPSLRNVVSAPTGSEQCALSKNKNKETARSFRGGLRPTLSNTSPSISVDETWRLEKKQPDWLRQLSRKSDFTDISECE